MKNRAIALGALLALACGSGTPARAQQALAARTYVSTGGSDANACSLAAPCRNFSAAVPKTAPAGEVTALESGSYGNVTVDRGITLQAAPGVLAALGTAVTTTPVVINASETSTVTLRNLQITRAGFSNATRGVQFNTGGALHVEGCVIAGFSDAGLFFGPPGLNSDNRPPRLFVKDTAVRDNGVGISLTTVSATISDCRVENNATGVLASIQSSAVVADSVLSGNTNYGVAASTGPASVAVENCVLTHNGSAAVHSSPNGGPGGTLVVVSGSYIAYNFRGLSGPGSLVSFGNNRFFGNTNSDGVFTDTRQEK